MTTERDTDIRMSTEWLPNGYVQLPTATDGFRGLSPQGCCRPHVLPCEDDRRNAAPQLALGRLHLQLPWLLAGRDGC